MSMQAAVFDEPGDPSVLHVAEVPKPKPSPRDVLIKVEAVSIEGGDTVWRRTLSGAKNHVVGYAAAGEVVEIGSEVTRVQVGDKVTTLNGDGSHAAFRIAPENMTWKLPTGINTTIGACLPCGPGTAEYSLQLSHAKKGETVLVLGAAGGVGLAAVQLAAKRGLKVVGTGTRPESLATLQEEYGLHEAIVSSPDLPPVSKQVIDKVGKVDLIIDNIGGDALIDSLEALRDGGRVVLVGVFGGLQTKLDAGKLLFRRHQVLGCLLYGAFLDPLDEDPVEATIEHVASGELKVPIEAEFHGLAEAAAAHRETERRGRIGRVVILP